MFLIPNEHKSKSLICYLSITAAIDIFVLFAQIKETFNGIVCIVKGFSSNYIEIKMCNTFHVFIKSVVKCTSQSTYTVYRNSWQPMMAVAGCSVTPHRDFYFWGHRCRCVIGVPTQIECTARICRRDCAMRIEDARINYLFAIIFV